VYVLVGPETPFGRRLVVRWDTDFLIAVNPALEERLRTACQAFTSAWEVWWGQMPQAVQRAMVPNPLSSVCMLGVSGGEVRAVEGAPRPAELAFTALNTAFGPTACDTPTAEWRTVADARAYCTAQLLIAVQEAKHDSLHTIACLVEAAVDDGALVAEPSRGQAQGVAQVTQRGAAQVPQFDPVQVVPDALVGIQVWRIAGQDLELDACRSTGRQERLHGLAMMDGGTIPDHQQLAGEIAQ
jgi:hypothetical protein